MVWACWPNRPPRRFICGAGCVRILHRRWLNCAGCWRFKAAPLPPGEGGVRARGTYAANQGLPRPCLLRRFDHRSGARLVRRGQATVGVTMGRVHERAVGPHPDWSCQLAFGPELIGVVLPWLALYRHGLVVFMHPDTGNDLLDHTDHAIWMGAIRPLDLSVF